MASISIVSSLRRPSVDLAKANHARHVTSQRRVMSTIRAVASPISTPSESHVSSRPLIEKRNEAMLPELISHDAIRSLEAELDNGASIAALRRFNENLRALNVTNWESKLRPVMAELAYNLESFNPAFTAVLLAVQSTIGSTDYVRRDMALKNLIQPLAGEYGMHNNEAQAKTHRELFSEFYADLMKESLEDLLMKSEPPAAGKLLFSQMMRDLSPFKSDGNSRDLVEHASYAMGYNLAIEYLADYEKTWMLDSFRALNNSILTPAGRPLTEWIFLEVHAEGEAEHAAIGHAAVASLVPASHEGVLGRAMRDHDRDFAAFYNKLADMLE